MLRHKGIPARIRIGFAAYIRISDAPCNVDHAVTEYHDGTRWRLVDAEQNSYLIEHNRIDFDVQDIPRSQFIVGGQAWQLCREEGADPLSSGSGPGDFFQGL